MGLSTVPAPTEREPCGEGGVAVTIARREREAARECPDPLADDLIRPFTTC